ncbi:MAG: cell division protein FtsW [Lachnospiraceae bacterium]|nr:cell division protein FtsW [Lachnospiraceae bacterium]
MEERTKQRTQRRVKQESYFDYSLLFIIIFLLCFGLVMIYSASSYEAQTEFGNASYYARKQLFSTVLGLIAMFFVTMLDYHIWYRFSGLAYVVSGILILLVMTPLGIEANGARRWLNLGLSLQPAEVAKLGSILFFSFMICKLGKKVHKLKSTLLLLALAGPIVLMIKVITSNLSSAIIVFGIVCLMIFVATPYYKRYLVLVVCAVVGVLGLVYLLVSGIIPEESSFRFGRIIAWLNPEDYPDTTGFQTLQALYAIGSGGILGKGLGASMQKLGFIPEAQNDMIFSIICEELGLFGAVAVMLLFLLMIWRFMIIANNAPDLYGALIVVGVMAHIAIQVILNIAVVTNTIPNTGISLPFISYGGSSVMFLLIEMGLVLSVSRRIKLDNT